MTLPKPRRSGAKSEGRLGKRDFVYLADENVYRCPAGEKLKGANLGSDSLLMKSGGRGVLIWRGESAPCVNRCGHSHWYPAVLLL